MAQGKGPASVGAGRYQLIRAVGRGGMATVYQATDTALGRRVAVKIMDRTAAGDDFRTRFRQEARAVAALNHRNVIAIHDIGEEPVPDGEPAPYLVTEFVDGRPLSELLSAGALPVDQALRITADVLDGLGASHDAGLVHRDIKPANVMVTEAGAVKILDFGLVRAVAAETAPITRAGTIVGTARYVSPEQAQGKALDHRSDLYSTGVLLFELLCGRRPFPAGTEAALLYHHVHTEPPLLSDLGVVVPEAVQSLLSGALRKDPADRPATARQMRSLVLEALRATGPDRPPTGRRSPPVPGTPPGTQRPRAADAPTSGRQPRFPDPPVHPPAPVRPPEPVPAPASVPAPEPVRRDEPAQGDEPVHAPVRQPSGSPAGPPAAPSTAGPGVLWAGLVAAGAGYIAGMLAIANIFTLAPTQQAVVGVYVLGYGPMYVPVLFGLVVGARRARAADPPAPHRSLAVACIAVNGLWAFYHLGTWLFGFPLLPL
ncbi:protein kinase [Streptomyces sp. Ru87]|uniref:protein kinase domain-containing protein n=1 Tax=Streptomyces sp. Ru87 TaxID=2044307 RepID=UPI0015D486C4|nr:protein kinase [Streptomyces sp. Ru87]